MLSRRLGCRSAVARKDCFRNSPMLVQACVFDIDPQHLKPQRQLQLLVDLLGRFDESQISRSLGNHLVNPDTEFKIPGDIDGS